MYSRVLLIGKCNLQNALLAERLLSDLPGDVCIVESVREAGRHAETDPVLCVLDCQGIELASLRESILDLGSNPGSPGIVLLNCSAPDSWLVRLLQASRLVATFSPDVAYPTLVKGLKMAISGEYWLSRRLLTAHLELSRGTPEAAPDTPDTLTDRERQVVAFLAQGHSNQQIAAALNISEHTVKTHLYKIYKKLGLKSRLQAANWMKSRLAWLGRHSVEELLNRKVEPCVS